MSFSEAELPSNRKFGFFFGLVLFLFAVYFLYRQSYIVATVLCFTSSLFIIITILNDKLLSRLNSFWMHFGILLGMIISPIIMGLIFFGIITPYAILMRISGRDALRLRNSENKSYWIIRSKDSLNSNLRNQF